MIDDRSVFENIKDNYESMFAAEKKVADFILSNPERAVTTNISELAELSGASDATVIRMCKRAGYEGYYQMKIKLSHDLGKDRTVQLQNGIQRPENINEVFQIITSNLMDTVERIDMAQITNCVNLIRNSKTVHIIATGNTIPIAMDLAFRLGKIGIRTTSAVIADYFLNNISVATSEELVIAITHSGTSRNVIKGLELAKERNVKSLVITNAERSPAARIADYVISTTVTNPVFRDSDYGLTSHIYEMAVVDAILYFIAIQKTQQENLDQVEFLLSESKL